ncbi:MAG TPA: prolipoprotein diacylglyceryl transferase [Epulopiscium sp.]|nr:prolipoprotein diacylglyceryl transferase [Candidatus Epulonipiscium sp.]
MPEIYFPHLNIQVKYLDRVAFSLFGLDVYWYGIIITLGIIAGLGLALHIARKSGQDEELYMDFLMYAIFFAFLGARLYYVIFKIGDYIQNPIEVFYLREGGLAIYGAIIASVIVAIIFTKRKNIRFGQFADTAIFGLIIGQVIGRWGNFVNREAFGDYTNSIFAMRLMKDQVSAPMTQKILDNLQVVSGISYIQVHPTFLYESLWNLALLIILLVYLKHKRFEGEILFLYLIGYGIGRLWIEGLRTDPLLLAILHIPVSQVVSGFIIMIGIIGIVFGERWSKG